MYDVVMEPKMKTGDDLVPSCMTRIQGGRGGASYEGMQAQEVTHNRNDSKWEVNWLRADWLTAS